MLPLQYTEGDLRLAAATADDGRLPEPLQHWMLAASPDDLQDLIAQAVSGCGFDWLVCTTLSWTDAMPAVARVFCSHGHPEDLRAYRNGQLPRTQAWHACQSTSVLPRVWELPVAERDASRPSSGLLVHLRAGPHSQESLLVDLSSRHGGLQWMGDEVLGSALLLAHGLHELLCAGTQPHTRPHEPLDASPTRRQVLWHVARGRSNKQIAHQMQMSVNTVKYHLAAMRRDFDARSRIELAGHAAGAPVA